MSQQQQELPQTSVCCQYLNLTTVKLIFSFLISFPLAALLKRVPDNRPDLKNGFIVGVSVFYLVGLFDLWSGTRTIFISAAGAYLISAFVRGPLMPWIGFVFLMGHMSVSHIARKYVGDDTQIDVTGAQMVMLMKLTAFCWNVHDGRYPDSELSDFQRQRAIRKLPPLLDYAGYVLFFPSFFAGPAFDYNEYKSWLECSMFELPPNVDPTKAPPTKKKRKIPRSGTPAAIKAAIGLTWLALYLYTAGWYTAERILGDKYLTYSLPRRIFILHMFGFSTRMKYYAVWSLTEGACILSGIGYNGVDPKTGRADWSRLQNVNPLGIELAQNTRAYLGNWNMNTNNWLRNYVYLRVTPKGKKPGFRASMATFVTSAFWHGFEAGYYLAFVLAAFNQTVAKNARRYLRPFVMQPDGKTAVKAKGFNNPKLFYDIASWLITQATFTFTVAPFILLSLDSCIRCWARVYFYAVIGVAASTAFFASPGRVWLKKTLERRNAKLSGSRPVPKRTETADDGPVAGLPDDPAREFDELFEEIRREVDHLRSSDLGPAEALQHAVQKLIDDGKVDVDKTQIDLDGERIRVTKKES